jgi:hypothetical protein
MEGNMQAIYILSGPQGIGKTRYAAELASLLQCRNIVDEWDGREELPQRTLAITSCEHTPPSGAVSLYIEDSRGLNALLRKLRSSAS